jgi:hypothetical protein
MGRFKIQGGRNRRGRVEILGGDVLRLATGTFSLLRTNRYHSQLRCIQARTGYGRPIDADPAGWRASDGVGCALAAG